MSCHGPDKEKGGLRIDTLSRDFKSGRDSHLWAEVVERINSGEMPPEDEPQPSIQHIATFVARLDAHIKEGKAARMAARPAVAHYRLSRQEYRNTVYDLLGVRYDPTRPGELNEDILWHGYERIGAQLSLSPSHMDRYFRAADLVLDRALPDDASEPRTVRKTAAELRYGGGEKQREALDRFGITRPLRYLMFPGRVQPALAPNWFGKTGPEHSGLYKFRIQASGIRPPGGQPAHLSVGEKTSEETVEGIIEFDITAPEDNPQIYEFEVFLEMPASLHFSVVATDGVDRRGGGAFRNALASGGGYVFTHSSETVLLNPNAPQMFDGEGNGIFSTVIVDWIEWEGPLVSEEEVSRKDQIQLPVEQSIEVVAERLQKFAERAWRRPVAMAELDGYLKSYQLDIEAGESEAYAWRSSLLRVLTSRHFIYLVEGDVSDRDRLNEWELASRLSYFLWSSMPDQQLFAEAERGLVEDVELEGVVERMLNDQKFDRFIEDFTRQWLQLHRVGMFPPDRKLYPTYDDWLETSMRAEPVEFFRELVVTNLPIDNLLDSDWTVVNPRLSDFYGLPEPETEKFQRVALTPENRRGGLTTMGAILGLSSDGTRHRPVHRGVWLSEVLFNRTPPPPPANVEPIEPIPPEGDKITVRDRLEVHANDANCASCHASIDPLGFAWENYDAIGQWREREVMLKGKGEDPVVDASGAMPDGRNFENADQFKQILIEDRDKVARAFVEHLCTYALRRVLTVDDEEDILAITEQAQRSEYRVRDIIRAVALSELLRKR
ncbi:MAG: DUF1592 domain-containing protein [Verrucomicrobiota bacterium]